MKKLLLLTTILLGALGLLFATNPLPQMPPFMVVNPGAASTNNGAMAYDSTNDMLHAAQNNADAMVPQFTITPTNNDPACWVVSGGNYKLGNTGCTAGSSVVKQAIVNVSSAQIKTLNASPVTIIGAQGIGTFIEFLSATVEFVSNGTQYTSGGGGLFFSLGGDQVSSAVSAGNFDGITSTGQIPYQNESYTGVIGGYDQRNVTLDFRNGTTPEFATGNGTLIIHCQYIVHTGL